MLPRNSRTVTVLFCALLVTCLGARAVSGELTAYSMRAARDGSSSGGDNRQVAELAGINRFVGMVCDSRGADIILVGQASPNEPTLALDDLVVALRARLVHKQWPLVSIDRVEQTARTGNQAVYFEGGIADTGLGDALLQADVVLKKIALGTASAGLPNLDSYFQRCLDEVARGAGRGRTSARFWFYPLQCSLAEREGVFVIDELSIGVRAQMLNDAATPGRGDSGLSPADRGASAFAADMTRLYDDLAAHSKEVARLGQMFRLVAVARGLEDLQENLDLAYWLDGYQVGRVSTPKEYKLLSRKERVSNDAAQLELELCGGVELRALILRFQDGDVTALRDAVLASRPSPETLSWSVPIEGWAVPGYRDDAVADASLPAPSPTLAGNLGCLIDRSVVQVGQSTPLPPPSLSRPPTGAEPSFLKSTALPPVSRSANVGGVMLSGSATVRSDSSPVVDLSAGNFSLVVDGQGARLDPRTFRKFITALWAVYYCDQDPGISIDPIAPGVGKHMVRYIGKVINTDLARVMLEADYTMKKWAVGTEKPDIPGFMSVDSLSAEYGLAYVGASRRFWFVPEAMTFKRGGDALLFDSGRMCVKTELMAPGSKVQSTPSDQAFASFFTEHYERIAAMHPVYRELFEYAKMVSLARYLKDNGVPLHWFLMANKDLVLTEDSPGTVDALAKGSDYWRGIRIEGGVTLARGGTYVYDANAVKAINKAFASAASSGRNASLESSGCAPRAVPATFSFKLDKDNYTVIPQHTLTSGMDSRGIRYQTDIALRTAEGEPGLELVRYFDPCRRTGGEFGNGWRLLIPYRVKASDGARMEFLNAMVPEKMTVVNLVTGREEVLSFSTDRYSIAGYVPDDIAKSQLVGLFLLSDGSFRLADKIGNEFQFSDSGCLTEMCISGDRGVRFEYCYGVNRAVDAGDCRIEAVGDKRQACLGMDLPARISVILASGQQELLTFNTGCLGPGYSPDDPSKSSILRVGVRSDASYRLVDKKGNEMAFDSLGRFGGIAGNADEPVVTAISSDDQEISFRYGISPSGDPVVVGARLSGGTDRVSRYAVSYEYDCDGSLAKVVRPRASGEIAGKTPGDQCLLLATAGVRQ